VILGVEGDVDDRQRVVALARPVERAVDDERAADEEERRPEEGRAARDRELVVRRRAAAEHRPQRHDREAHGGGLEHREHVGVGDGAVDEDLRVEVAVAGLDLARDAGLLGVLIARRFGRQRDDGTPKAAARISMPQAEPLLSSSPVVHSKPSHDTVCATAPALAFRLFAKSSSSS
jgi:hypothetical protein